MKLALILGTALLLASGCSADSDMPPSLTEAGDADDSKHFVEVQISHEPSSYRVECNETFSCDVEIALTLSGKGVEEIADYLEDELGERAKALIQVGELRFLNPGNVAVPIAVGVSRVEGAAESDLEIDVDGTTEYNLHLPNPDETVWTELVLAEDVPAASLPFEIYTKIW